MAGDQQQPTSSRGVVISVNLARMTKVRLGDLRYDTGIPVTLGLLAYLIYTDHRLAAQLVEMLEQDLTREQWRDFLKERLAS